MKSECLSGYQILSETKRKYQNKIQSTKNQILNKIAGPKHTENQ